MHNTATSNPVHIVTKMILSNPISIGVGLFTGITGEVYTASFILDKLAAGCSIRTGQSVA